MVYFEDFSSQIERLADVESRKNEVVKVSWLLSMILLHTLCKCADNLKKMLAAVRELEDRLERTNDKLLREEETAEMYQSKHKAAVNETKMLEKKLVGNLTDLALMLKFHMAVNAHYVNIGY